MTKRNKKLTHATLLKADRDGRKAASAAALGYVSDGNRGIRRVKRGKNFVYFLGSKQVKDKTQLERIRKLAIPPAWTDVWICKSPNGHIQATGFDVRKRKQYRYHAKWNELRNETKFHKLFEFGKQLPRIRRRIKKDIGLPELTREKVLATVIDLMDKTYIRVGNNDYEKMNGSYGLTTFKDKHVKLSQGKIIFSFTGKKGIDHTVHLKDKKLARIVKQCRDIPGKPLFQYYDVEGNQRPIDSGMVNAYIKEVSGAEFSAKDFRTWAGSVQAVEFFRSPETTLDKKDFKKNVLAMLDSVSQKLGNSRNVCKKYYVHPQLVKLCEENLIGDALKSNGKKKTRGFTEGEEVLMCILRKAL
jgi:DNA topoisomerase I